MSLRKTTTQGFTLIELLVVVAIIAILSGIVLVTLNGARSKAKDARIISEMGSIRSQAQLFYTNYGNYIGTGPSNVLYTCADGLFGTVDTDNASQLLTDITNTVGAGNRACFASEEHWAFTAHLSDGRIWCVDSNGASKLGVNSDGITPATQMSWAVSWAPTYSCF